MTALEGASTEEILRVIVRRLDAQQQPRTPGDWLRNNAAVLSIVGGILAAGYFLIFSPLRVDIADLKTRDGRIEKVQIEHGKQIEKLLERTRP